MNDQYPNTPIRRHGNALIVAGVGLSICVAGIGLAAQAASATSTGSTSVTSTSDASDAVHFSDGEWEVSVGTTTSTLEMSSQADGSLATAGSAALEDVANDDVNAFGDLVMGGDFGLGTGTHLMAFGQAGSDVTAVAVTTSIGRVVDAQVKDGVWLAAWTGDVDDEAADSQTASEEYTITFTTTEGAQHAVGSSEVSTGN